MAFTIIDNFINTCFGHTASSTLGNLFSSAHKNYVIGTGEVVAKRYKNVYKQNFNKTKIVVTSVVDFPQAK